VYKLICKLDSFYTFMSFKLPLGDKFIGVYIYESTLQLIPMDIDGSFKKTAYRIPYFFNLQTNLLTNKRTNL